MKEELRGRLAGNLERTAPENGLRRRNAEGAKSPFCAAENRKGEALATKVIVGK